ncbi:MAG: hypothetical protein AAGK67_03460 [Pseudomonadota bacterium]
MNQTAMRVDDTNQAHTTHDPTAFHIALSDLVILRGIPSCIRLDNGPEFVAKAVQDWIKSRSCTINQIGPPK